jgi:glucan phosphorylase
MMDTFHLHRNDNPKHILKVKSILNKDHLTIGFARRFATYKRGNLLFKDLERLSKIVNNTEKPVQFIFAGKAHPKDEGGQSIIKQIVEISMKSEFVGKIIFLEDYNITLAKELVRGVDVWLNTPTRPLEASGTSGMKAVMNGVLNFSVLDGWWVEGFKEGAGWSLSQEKTYTNQDLQNEYDAEQIYQTLENEIIPLYYSRNKKGIPQEWVEYIKKCISEIAPEFTTKRMIDDYNDRYYSNLSNRRAKVIADNFAVAKEIAEWKENIREEWYKLELISADTSNLRGEMLVPGEVYNGKLILNINGLKTEHIGVEFVISESNTYGQLEITKVIDLRLDNVEGSIAYFSFEYSPSKPGSINYAFRAYPKNELLAHRQDCPIVKWL